MSRYIDADAVIKAIAEFNKYEDEFEYPYASDDLEEYKDDARAFLEDIPTIDLDDYVPREFHDKTCEAMAKRHQEEIADMVSVVRKPVKDYEGYYEVDQFGRVFSLDRVVRVDDNGRVYDKPIKGGQLKQHMHSKGYKVVCLTKDGKSKNAYVHRLVAEAFIPNANELPFINHKDEDKTNNFVDNLEWCTEQYNSTYGNARKKQADALRGRPLSEEHKEKIRQGNIGKHGKSIGEREGK